METFLTLYINSLYSAINKNAILPLVLRADIEGDPKMTKCAVCSHLNVILYTWKQKRRNNYFCM